MANRLKGEAEFTDGDNDYRIVMDAEALLQVEDRTGFGLLDLNAGLTRLGVLAALLIAGVMRGSGQELSRAEAAEMLMVNPAARDAVMLALERALPDQKEGADKSDPPKAARKGGTGKRS